MSRRRPDSYRVPAGLLDGDVAARVSKHICVDSKAPWDTLAEVPSSSCAPLNERHAINGSLNASSDELPLVKRNPFTLPMKMKLDRRLGDAKRDWPD